MGQAIKKREKIDEIFLDLELKSCEIYYRFFWLVLYCYMGSWFRVALVSALLYVIVFLSWILPWLLVASYLEPYAIVLLCCMHACFASFLWSLYRLYPVNSSVSSPSVFSSFLGRSVSLSDAPLMGRLLASACACLCSSSLGALLRLCELGGFLHVGPVAVGSDSSLAVVALLFAAELVAAALIPVTIFALRAHKRATAISWIALFAD